MDERLPHGRSLAADQLTVMVDTSMDPAKPRAYVTPVRTLPLKIWRQFLGINPFKGSYFGLFTTLHRTSDRLVTMTAAMFAIAAGVPLPIIGVIYGKIVSDFPPSEDEMRTRIEQLLGVAVASFVITSTYTICFGRTGEKIATGLRMKLLSKLLHIDQAYLDTHDTDITALLGEKIDTIQVGCSEKVGIFIQSMSYFVAAFTVGFILNAKLTGILFAAVIPTMTIIVYFGSTATSKLTKASSRHTEYANAIAESALRAVRLLQAYDMMGRICASHRAHIKQSSAVGYRKAVVTAIQFGMTYFTAYSANALAFYIGSRMAASGESGGEAGTVYAVVFLILDASFVVGQFIPFLEIFARAAGSYGTIQDILEAPSMSGGPKYQESCQRKLDLASKELRFEHVLFSYPARPTVQVLSSLNLTVRAGAFNAVVGTSGGGKSTLVSLLLRMYDYSGRIMIGSHELRSLDIGVLRSQIAVVDQDSVLLAGTIYENICHGLVGQDIPESTRALLCKEAATRAGLDFLGLLPNGIHTVIDSTLQLSGGQKQRVCLARALIRRPAVLILDEPTSALDAHSELRVMRAVKAAVADGTTVLMIAHRLSTVIEAEHIAVVSNGCVVEEGAPADLSKDGTIFRGLLDAQTTKMTAASPILESPSATSESSMLHESNKVEVESARPADTDNNNCPVQPRLRQLLKTFNQLSKPEHFLIIIGLSAATISGCIILGEAIVFGNLVQLLNTGQDDVNFQSEASLYCLMYFVVALVALVSYIASGAAFGIASNRVATRVQTVLLEKMLHLDIAWFSGPGRSVQELTSTISKESSDLACLSGIALGTIFTVIVSVVGGIILAHVIAWKIAIVLLAAVPVMLASGYIRLRLLAKSEDRQRSAYREPTALAIECCQSRKTVTALGLEDYCLDRYRKALRAPYKAGLTSSVLCNTLLAFSLTITYFVYALAYWWGSKQVRNGMYSQKQFFTALVALLFTAQAAGSLFSLSPEIARARTAAANVFRLLSFQPTILSCADPDVKQMTSGTPSETTLAPVGCDQSAKLEFDCTSFSYSSSKDRSALNNVTFTINSGQTVAFVGPSGAGKSSILALMERFFDPTNGRILFEGNDVHHIDVRKLRQRFSLVPQDSELFPGSINYNIRLGARLKQTITQDMIEVAAKQCGMHDFITSLPDGYNTECGSMSNSRFSGGQRQRLALARALIREPEVLLLDEPTSSLDAVSEQQIQEALKQVSKGRTTVTVAHRLASIRDADKIVVLDSGRVVEQGTHAELVQLGGLYASMARAQLLT